MNAPDSYLPRALASTGPFVSHGLCAGSHHTKRARRPAPGPTGTGDHRGARTHPWTTAPHRTAQCVAPEPRQVVARRGDDVRPARRPRRPCGCLRATTAISASAIHHREGVAPAVRFELTTKRLTVARSTTELRRNGDAGLRADAGTARAADVESTPRDRIARGRGRTGRPDPHGASIGLSGRLPHSSHEPA
jgi:hypothetical protein